MKTDVLEWSTRLFKSFGLLILLLALVLAGCASEADTAETDGTAGSDGTTATTTGDGEPATTMDQTETTEAAAASVTVGLGSGLVSLDPAKDQAFQANNLYLHIFDPLVRLDRSLDVQASLAESWEVIDDVTWEFRLREAFWHDGEPVTAEDVQFTIERIGIEDLASPLTSYVAAIADVEVVDERTFRIITDGPYAPLLRRMSYIAIVPEHVIEAVGNDGFAENPVGSGPFRFVEFVADSHLTLEANNDYWGATPATSNLTFRFIPEEGARVAALQAGEVDLITNLPPERVEEIEGSGGLRVENITSLSTMFVSIATEQPPLDDPLVRQALNYAVDKQAIIDSILLGNGDVSGQPMQPAVPGYNEDIDPYPYDPDRARELLAEAGYPDGITVEFDIYQGRYLKDQEIAQAVAAQLNQVGIQTELMPAAYTDTLQRFSGGELQGLYLQSALNPIGDPDFPLALFFGPTGLGYYPNDSVEADVERLASVLDPDERFEGYEELLAQLHSDAPWIYLFDVRDVFGVADTLPDWKPRPDGRLLLFDTE